MHKCDFCKNDSNCSVAKRRECIVRDYFWFEFERAQEDDTKTIAVFFLITMGTTIQKRLQNTLLEITLV